MLLQWQVRHCCRNPKYLGRHYKMIVTSVQSNFDVIGSKSQFAGLKWALGSVAEWLGAWFVRRPWLQGWWFNSRPSFVVASLDKMLGDNYFYLVESNKQHVKEVKSKTKRKTRKRRQLLSESVFVLCVAPPSLYRDRRLIMKKNIRKFLI